MKRNTPLIVGGILIALVLVIWARQSSQKADVPPTAQAEGRAAQKTTPPRVPAHYETVPALTSLAPTLPPDRFTGKTREAYRVVREIPQTIAQLPCYCYCDEGHGHKSLHSCFENEHASQYAVCTDEALMAYRMEKEQGLSPAQIRERIIAQYSSPRQ